MGEIADTMLDGTLCAGCGVYLDVEPAGYPIYCSPQCEPDFGHHPQNMPPLKSKSKCPICGARKWNVEEHARVKHPNIVMGSHKQLEML